ncbi:hypothetical protein L342_3927 [Escherichia coli CE516]|nr:hypothetical protein L342_3927 [Escherichia coli CE516]ESS99804.1 hypothetical protein L341_2808 [Escherichia coli CE418]
MLLCFVPDAGCDAGASYPAYGVLNLLMLLCFVPDAGCDAGASYPAYGLFNSLMLLDFVGRIRRFRRIRQPVFTR